MPTETKPVPAAALTLSVGQFEFGSNGENAKTIPVTLKARSAQPIEHWYWGRVVHDMAGMKLNKERLPIDYVHDTGEIVGYLNHFTADANGLSASGALVPYQNGDRANEIVYKAAAGIPYECSINFGGDGIVVEEVGANATVKVNGYDFKGPGMVVRQWPLRGVAICPYGADANTETQFKDQKQVNVTLFSKENAMSETKPAEVASAAVEAEVKPAASKPAELAQVAPKAKEAEKPAVELAAEVKPETPAPAATVEAITFSAPKADVAAIFGADDAAKINDGPALWSGIKARITKLTGDLSDANAAKVELQAKVDAAPRGNDPVAFSPTDQKPEAKVDAEKEAKLTPTLGAGLARFAAGLKFAKAGK